MLEARVNKQWREYSIDDLPTKAEGYRVTTAQGTARFAFWQDAVSAENASQIIQVGGRRVSEPVKSEFDAKVRH